MNQVFNFHRFCLLFGKHWADNKKRYSLTVIAFMGLLFLWYIFIFTVSSGDVYHADFQRIVYYFCLFLGGAIYASQLFKELGSKPKGINYLMTPASMFEKLLCGFLHGIVLTFIVITAVFYFVDATMISIVNWYHELPNYVEVHNYINGVEVPPYKLKVVNVFDLQNNREINFAQYFLLAFLSVQSLFILGSVYFRRYSFIKTIIIIFVLLFTFILMEGGFQKFILAFNSVDVSFSSFLISHNPHVVVHIPSWIPYILLGLLKYATPLFLWCVTYFRLKEKEI